MQTSVQAPDGREIVLDDGVLAPHREALGQAASPPARVAFAAAHVVMREEYRALPHSLEHPGDAAEIADHVDWQATMAIRTRLDGCGFGIAEAMDTAQRFYLGWPSAERLIRECGRLAPKNGFVAGAGVDHLEHIGSRGDLIDGVVHQARIIQEAGGIVILLPLVWLAQQQTDEDGYVEVYGEIIRQLEGPLLVHWLGEMFLPALRGYFPGRSFDRIMALDPAKVRGCKLSLLDAEHERRVRAELLPRDQIVLTGDDFHFGELILGEDQAIERRSELGGLDLPLGRFSHALLGIFDGIAAPAGLALQLLAAGDVERYRALMAPCEELGRWVFQKPTQHYKAGLAFLAWLGGHQGNFMLVNREDRARDLDHYLRAAELASAAGVIEDAAIAASRLEQLIASQQSPS